MMGILKHKIVILVPLISTLISITQSRTSQILSPKCTNPPFDSCEFYMECVEPVVPCGPKGYTLSYGSPFCYAYLDKTSIFQPETQPWLSGVRHCLQTRLVPIVKGDVTLSCDQLRDYAFQTHAVCYTEGKPNICDMRLADLGKVGVIALRDPTNPYLVHTGIDVLKFCLYGIKPQISISSE